MASKTRVAFTYRNDETSVGHSDRAGASTAKMRTAMGQV